METWNLKILLSGKSPEKLIDELKKKIDSFKKKRIELKDVSAKKLLSIIKLKEEIQTVAVRVHVYYYLKFFEKTNDSKTLAKLSFFNQFVTEIGNEMQFFPIWFMNLSETEAKKYFNAEELKDYKYYLLLIRQVKDYTKSEEIERIISLKSIVGRSSYAALYDLITSGFKYDFEGKEITQEELIKKYYSKDPSIREKAYKTILAKYADNSTVLSEIYKNIVTDWYNEEIKIRNYPSPISKRNMSNDLDDKTVKTLLKVIKKNTDVFRDYFKIKYELIKKTGQEYPFSRFHLYTPYNSKDIKYNYEESKKLVLETYKRFDERFYNAAKEIFDKNHVHSHPAPNKRTGAFCFSVDNTTTPYIMLNFANSLDDVFTMMHEFGHGIHGVFARKQVNLLYDTSLAMAETASIFGEMILADRMINESEKEAKKSILMYQLDRQYASIGRQAFFVYFEEYAHDAIKNGASKEDLEKEYLKLLKEQFGEMEVPDEFKNEWNYIPHIHNSPFYCYAYAWGNLMVLSLYALYREKGKDFIDKYVEILSAGGGKSPKELLSIVGIDPDDENFWQKGFDIIREEVKRLKELK